MTCPNCSHPMNFVSADKQNILHCTNCGASFFEENAINRISNTTAKMLAEDKKTSQVSGAEKICPNDHNVFRPVEESEAIPPNITLLKCDSCQGIFVFPDDLLAFKKAQGAKIEFFRAWAKPLSSLRTVLVVSFTIFVLGTVIYRSSFFLNRFSQSTQASDLITKVNFSKSGHYLLIFFKTKTALQSSIYINDRSFNQAFLKNISSQPKTIHQLTTGELNLENDLWYKIILIDATGKEIRTEIKKLEVNQPE